MARIIAGIHGPFSGKVGSVVGASWKGIPYMRAKPGKRSGKISLKEENNRIKFAMAQKWLDPLLKFVREGFRGYSPTFEGYVAAKSYLLKNAIEGEGPDWRINPANMQVSYGDLPLSDGLTVEQLADGTIRFSWDADSVKYEYSNDQVMILAYNIEGKSAHYHTYGEHRHKGADALPLSLNTGTWHLYMAFVAGDRSRQSHSVYMGAVTV